MIDMYCIDWDAVSSITSVIMMGIALFTLWVTYQQRRDELRARLSFEIISWNGLFLLKITNVGKESAYNIQLNFSGEFLETHFSNEIKNEAEAASIKYLSNYSQTDFIAPKKENKALSNVTKEPWYKRIFAWFKKK